MSAPTDAEILHELNETAELLGYLEGLLDDDGLGRRATDCRDQAARLRALAAKIEGRAEA